MTPQANDPLASLRDIHLPPPVTSWIPAPGWWMVALSLIAIALLAFYAKRQRQRSAQRMALREIDLIVAETTELQELATGFSELLRRAAILRFGATQVASLHGHQWEQFLTTHSKGLEPPVFALLAEAPYAPPQIVGSAIETIATREQLITETRRWIRRNL